MEEMEADYLKNAVILAAGKSNRFAPFTYEKPKGLFRVKGEILIERQINQLHEAGIEDIYVVVGYMKEKFFYLEQKLGVRLIVNNEFDRKGNLYSLYVARKFLGNTYICCADHYFLKNPFVEEDPADRSYRACTYLHGKFSEFAVECSDADVITNMEIGGRDSLAMVGHAYMDQSFSQRFCRFMEDEIHDFGVSSMFWEEFYRKHIRQLTFYKKEFPDDEILEFDNIEDLRMFDSEFLLNIDSEIVTNICHALQCSPNEILNISVINAGLTNVSFSFACRGETYVYRHPGATAGYLTDRRAELFAQTEAKKAGLDDSFLCMELSGWKLSRFVEEARYCDFEGSGEQLNMAMEYLHKLHKIRPDDTVRLFDNVAEGKKLMKIASATKGNLFREFKEIIEKIDILYEFVKADARRLGFERVLCHNDTYAPNYLCDKNGKIYLIDWEYAGLNYGANDIGCILCRYDWTEQQIERYLRAYAGHELSAEEYRYYMAFLPISAFYWFCWGLYKGSVGDDDSFFFLPSYRNLVRFLDRALDRYRQL